MTDLACACPVTDVQAMGAVRAAGLNWVAVSKRDPHAPGFPEQIEVPRAEARGSLRNCWQEGQFTLPHPFYHDFERGRF